MKSNTLKSERLFLTPLTLTELIDISGGGLNAAGFSIDSEAVTEPVISAMRKKAAKMRLVGEDAHLWYTYWLMIDKASRTGIGFIGFKGEPDQAGLTEVGYGISPSHRQKGLTTEALAALTLWAGGFERCKGITAKKVLKTNTGSIKVLQNCGFELVCSDEQENNYVLEFK